MEKDHLSIKKVAKILRNSSKIKTLGTCSNSYPPVSCCSPYVQVNSLNYSPFSSLQLQKKSRGKDKENQKYHYFLLFV